MGLAAAPDRETGQDGQVKNKNDCYRRQKQVPDSNLFGWFDSPDCTAGWLAIILFILVENLPYRTWPALLKRMYIP
jgi:hypothetical protein